MGTVEIINSHPVDDDDDKDWYEHLLEELEALTEATETLAAMRLVTKDVPATANATNSAKETEGSALIFQSEARNQPRFFIPFNCPQPNFY